MNFTKKKIKKETIDDKLKQLFVKTEKSAIKNIKSRLYLKDILVKAGYNNVDSEILKSKVLYYNMIFIAALSVLLLGYGVVTGTIAKLFITLLLLWILAFPFFLLATWIAIYLFLDYHKFKRRQAIEEVWAEYLQLVVANINAGMLIDVAMWSAIKPKYKVLAKEIEEVAKQTLTGEDLTVALEAFAEKYDSPTLQRTVSILIEGLNSGGQIGTLLNKIALDIEETKVLKKEMAAGVMTYAIFISFATVAAAPFLFALSTVLLSVVQKIVGGMAASGATSTVGFMTLKAGSVKISDFKIFAYLMLSISSLMSAFLISTIRKGSVKEGLKYIPIFIITTLLIYYFGTMLLSYMMSGLI